MSAKTYHRAPKGDLVTMSRTELDRDGHLSAMARMIMVLAAGCKDDFRLTIEFLLRYMQPAHGRDAVRKGVAELRLAGYAKARCAKNADGTFAHWFDFFELPLPADQRDKTAGRGSRPGGRKPTTGQVEALNRGAPKPENPTVVDTSPKPENPTVDESTHAWKSASGEPHCGFPVDKSVQLRLQQQQPQQQTEKDLGGKTVLETCVPVSPPSSPSGEGGGGDPLPGSPKTRKSKVPVRPLKAKLTAGELRQAQLANPALHPLALFQLADLFDLWRRRKEKFKDVAKRRKSHPAEHDWDWFQIDMTAFEEWRDLVDHLTDPDTRSPAAIDAVNARQVETLGDPPRDWLEEAYRSLFGRDPEQPSQLDEPPMPPFWRALPLWRRELILGKYVPGTVRLAALMSNPKRKTVGVGSTVSRSDQVAASRKAFPGMHSPQDQADLDAVKASTAARLQPAKTAPLPATPPATQPAPVTPPEPPFIDPSPEPDPDDIFAQ